MGMAAFIQAAVAAITAYFAEEGKARAEQHAMDILNRARDDYGQIDLPTLEQITNKELGPSAFEQIKTDAKLIQAQYGALDKLGEVSNGGMTMQDQAVLNAAMGKVARQEGAGRGAIRENMAARGTLGSGAELAMSLQNQQASADRANQVGMDVAGRAQQRALDAIIQRGQLAGQMRGQDFNEKSQVAHAKDLIARYNATRGSQGYKDLFNMRLQRTAGMNGQNPLMADSARRQGDNAAALAGGVGGAVNQGITSYAQWKNSQPGGGTSYAPKDDDEILKEAELYDYE